MRTQPKAYTKILRSNFVGIRLHIEYVRPGRIGIRSRQLKKHGKAYIARLAAAIDRFGFVVPLLVDKNYNLIMGHGRLAAAILLKMPDVPVICVDHITEEQQRLLAIFENKIVEASEWDDEALNLEFEELRVANPTLELSDSGFSIGEIDALAGRIRTSELGDLNSVAEPPPADAAVSRVGDIWQCGRHRIINGDATDLDVIVRLVQGQRIRQIVTDPPFNLPTRAFSSSGRHGNFEMAAGELGDPRFVMFLTQFLLAIVPHLLDGAMIYAFMDWKHIHQLIEAGKGAGLTYKQLLAWVKPTAGMGSHYRSGHELVGVFKHGNAPSLNTVQLGRYGRNRSNVLAYPGVMGMASGKRAMKLHPTVKNVAMIADLILDASAPGDNILDSFGGSGTTMIAAEKTGRTAFLCELSPGYVDVAVERFNALGGTQAILVDTGQTFAQVLAAPGWRRQLVVP